MIAGTKDIQIVVNGQFRAAPRGRSVVEVLAWLGIDGGRVAFTIELTTPACPVKEQMRNQAHAAVMALAGVTAVDIEMSASVRAVASPESGRAPIDGVISERLLGMPKGY